MVIAIIITTYMGNSDDDESITSSFMSESSSSLLWLMQLASLSTLSGSPTLARLTDRANSCLALAMLLLVRALPPHVIGWGGHVPSPSFPICHACVLNWVDCSSVVSWCSLFVGRLGHWVCRESWTHKRLFNLPPQFSRLGTQGPTSFVWLYVFVYVCFCVVYISMCTCMYCWVWLGVFLFFLTCLLIARVLYTCFSMYGTCNLFVGVTKQQTCMSSP